jgi:hypothetical protein
VLTACSKLFRDTVCDLLPPLPTETLPVAYPSHAYRMPRGLRVTALRRNYVSRQRGKNKQKIRLRRR